MPDALREALEREAQINGRSLNAEILARLGASLGGELDGTPSAIRNHVQETAGRYGESMSDAERSMLTVFRRWPADKQLSFLVLFN